MILFARVYTIGNKKYSNNTLTTKTKAKAKAKNSPKVVCSSLKQFKLTQGSMDGINGLMKAI